MLIIFLFCFDSDENEEGISADDEADERIEKNRGKIVVYIHSTLYYTSS